MRNTAGIHDRLGTAALVLGAVDTILRSELEGDSHHNIALLKQQCGCCGGADSTAHAYNNPDFACPSQQETYGRRKQAQSTGVRAANERSNQVNSLRSPRWTPIRAGDAGLLVILR